MYVGYAQMTSTAGVQTIPEALIPPKATHAELQADTQNIRYTACKTPVDPTSARGMLFLTTEPPKFMVIDEVRLLRFTSGAGGAGNLNIHFIAGRDI
jgi:hypothetical protein